MNADGKPEEKATNNNRFNNSGSGMNRSDHNRFNNNRFNNNRFNNNRFNNNKFNRKTSSLKRWVCAAVCHCNSFSFRRRLWRRSCGQAAATAVRNVTAAASGDAVDGCHAVCASDPDITYCGSDSAGRNVRRNHCAGSAVGYDRCVHAVYAGRRQGSARTVYAIRGHGSFRTVYTVRRHGSAGEIGRAHV